MSWVQGLPCRLVSPPIFNVLGMISRRFSKIYENLFKNIAANISKEHIHSISFGMMRFPKKMFKKMIKENPNKKINSLNFENRNGIYSYRKDMKKKLENIIVKKLNKYMKNIPIYKCKV